MPFGLYDPNGKIIDEYYAAHISTVVVLAESDECKDKSGRDLFGLYREQGFGTIDLPIPNYGVPNSNVICETLAKAEQLCVAGNNVVIHCSAGLGRTPFFAALLAKRVLKISGIEALAWLSRHKPDALLTPLQIMVILA